MITAALTGGIATGKTEVLRVAEKYNRVETIQADNLAKEIYSPDNPHFGEVVDLLGSDILTEEGEIDLEAVSKKVFSDKDLLSRLESIAHPYVEEKLKELIVRYKNRDMHLLIIEIPLLFQSSSVDLDSFDRIILVDASEETQVERLKERDCLSEEAARERVQLQQFPEDAREKSDYVIETEGSLAETRQLAEELIEKLLG